MQNNEQRSFESRLLFIRDIFNNPHPKEEIMTSCINFKLKNSLNNYIADLDRSINALENANTMTVLKRMK